MSEALSLDAVLLLTDRELDCRYRARGTETLTVRLKLSRGLVNRLRDEMEYSAAEAADVIAWWLEKSHYEHLDRD